MRLWHKDLISVLPKQQLVGQWRECCLIAKNIDEKGTPNHILVNRIMNYPIRHFYVYSEMVSLEMCNRGYKPDFGRFQKYFETDYIQYVSKYDLFKTWHNRRYMQQCYYNLQEKYDCGGITNEEWNKIQHLCGCYLVY